jgi:multisubunit Na+/H+ antiporter MnhF subunit
MFIDVAIAYGILGFLETIVFAKFLEVRSWL